MYGIVNRGPKKFSLELWRFEREKGGWEPQKTVMRKGSEELPPPLSHFCEFRHKLNFFGPPLHGG